MKSLLHVMLATGCLTLKFFKSNYNFSMNVNGLEKSDRIKKIKEGTNQQAKTVQLTFVAELNSRNLWIGSISLQIDGLVYYGKIKALLQSKPNVRSVMIRWKADASEASGCYLQIFFRPYCCNQTSHPSFYLRSESMNDWIFVNPFNPSFTLLKHTLPSEGFFIKCNDAGKSLNTAQKIYLPLQE